MRNLKIAIYSCSVGILGVAAFVIAFGIFLLILSSRKVDTADAQRFNTNRQPLSDNALETQIFPEQVGNYILQKSLEKSSNTDSPRYFMHDYKLSTLFNTGTIGLYARSLEKDYSQTTLLSGGTDCGEVMGTAQLYPKAITPYGYTFCDSWTYNQHTFNWINGNWLISASSASTLHSDSNMLLEFVNLYNY